MYMLMYTTVQCLWWVRKIDDDATMSLPLAEEAAHRLSYLKENGPSQFAFTLDTRFPPPKGSALAEPEG